MPESVVFAIDIGGKSIKTGIVDDNGLKMVFEPCQLAHDLDSNSFFINLRNQIIENLFTYQNHVTRAIGIGIPGLVDRDTGISYSATNLPWNQTNFKTLIESWTGLPTFVEHDVRSGAIAEARFGALKGFKDYLYVAIGTGLGAAISIRGTIYTGSSGFGGELGHTIVIPNGRKCDCGRIGCLEAYCSAKYIERRYTEETGLSLSCKEIAFLAQRSEPIAKTIWDDATYALALGLVNYHSLLQPKAIVIGGGVADAGEELLLKPTIAKMNELVQGIELPKIVFSDLKHQSALVGAGYQAMTRYGGETA